MSGPYDGTVLLAVEGFFGAVLTRAYDSSLTIDTASDTGRGVPTFDSDCPRLTDLTSCFFWTISSSGRMAKLPILVLFSVLFE